MEAPKDHRGATRMWVDWVLSQGSLWRMLDTIAFVRTIVRPYMGVPPVLIADEPDVEHEGTTSSPTPSSSGVRLKKE